MLIFGAATPCAPGCVLAPATGVPQTGTLTDTATITASNVTPSDADDSATATVLLVPDGTSRGRGTAQRPPASSQARGAAAFSPTRPPAGGSPSPWLRFPHCRAMPVRGRPAPAGQDARRYRGS